MRGAFCLSTYFSLILPACASESPTADCHPTPRKSTEVISLTEDELKGMIQPEGHILPSDCEFLCRPIAYHGSAHNCRLLDGSPVDAGSGEAGTQSTADAGGQRQLECTISRTLPCRGRRHAVLGQSRPAAGPSKLAVWFAEAAYEETASVPAFLELRRELLAVGAPKVLLDRMLRAATDEVEHARSMNALAAVYGGHTPKLAYKGPILARSVYSVAVENAVEGCVNETFSALLAAHQAAHACHPEVRAALGRIAPDELRHGQLAWDVHFWLMERLDEDAQASVHAAMRSAAARLIANAGKGMPGRMVRELLGLPSPAKAEALAGSLADRLWH